MPKILNFVKKIHYYCELFTSLVRRALLPSGVKDVRVFADSGFFLATDTYVELKRYGVEGMQITRSLPAGCVKAFS